MRKNVLSHLLLSFLTLTVTPLLGQTTRVTLEECSSSARANYPLIRQHELIQKSSEFTIANANKAFLPQLSITAIGAYIINGLPGANIPGTATKEPERVQAIGMFQLNQTIWDGGATRASKNITTVAAETEKAYVDVQLFAIAQRVNDIYFGILIIDEQLKLLDLSERNLKLNFDRLKLNSENGLGDRVAVDEVEAELLKVGQRRLEFRFARMGYVDMLSHFIGRPLPEDVVIQKPVVSENVLTAGNNRPELAWYANRVRLTESQSSMSRVGVMPKVGILGAAVLISPGAQFGPSTLTNLSLVGISASWNTGGLYRQNNLKELDRLQLDRIGTEKAAFEFNQSLELKQIGAETAKQRAILETDARIVELKTRIHQSQQLKFDNGLCSTSELIQSINNEQDARSNQQLHEILWLKSLYAYKTSLGN